MTDEIYELSCNLDDMTGEELGFAMEVLLSSGALDVYTVPIGMKKNRPGVMLNVLCRPESREEMVKLLVFREFFVYLRKIPPYKLNQPVKVNFRLREIFRLVDDFHPKHQLVVLLPSKDHGFRRVWQLLDDTFDFLWEHVLAVLHHDDIFLSSGNPQVSSSIKFA